MKLYFIAVFTIVASIAEFSLVQGSTYSKNALNRVKLGNKLYYFSDFKATWFEAATFCHLYGMKLVKVENENENNSISYYLYVKGNEEAFTSGNRMSSSKWLWADGTPLVYTNWYNGEKNNNEGQKSCLIIRSLKHSKQGWADKSCHSTLNFICEDFLTL